MAVCNILQLKLFYEGVGVKLAISNFILAVLKIFQLDLQGSLKKDYKFLKK